MVRYLSPRCSASPSALLPRLPQPPNLASPLRPLAASPPTFTSPPPPATKARLHQRSVMLSLDLDGASVEHFELAGSDGDVRDDAGSSAPSSVWGSCGHSPGSCDSDLLVCLAAYDPLHSPSPAVAIASSSNSSLSGPQLSRLGQWSWSRVLGMLLTSVVGQFVVAQDPLRQPVQQSKKFFHLPSSLSSRRKRLVDEVRRRLSMLRPW
ncbi:hypothetical protein DFP72DRAFT_1135362 [Ephemerocybe angulata]|uniref:Uncharacterized protein n=1 Tax=Ephemerocybe angulata TaxID=980116 RepID=A0A8H6HR13_9AGAR|nr:hypothetical protein DFP72DRAFT_1135362 [Tulosesus angulatus]